VPPHLALERDEDIKFIKWPVNFENCMLDCQNISGGEGIMIWSKVERDWLTIITTGGGRVKIVRKSIHIRITF